VADYLKGWAPSLVCGFQFSVCSFSNSLAHPLFH
jgi:hypothetical protein